MRLHEILTEAGRYELDVSFRDGSVAVSYGEKNATIYQAEESGDGIIFTPVSPWGGDPVYTDTHDPQAAWAQVKDAIRHNVIKAFGAVSPRAKRAAKRIGMINR